MKLQGILFPERFIQLPKFAVSTPAVDLHLCVPQISVSELYGQEEDWVS